MTQDIGQARLLPETVPMAEVQRRRLYPQINNTPDLPVIDWGLIGQQAPVLLDSPPDSLPEANVVIITWTASEWAALDHVFCSSGASMPYSHQHEKQRAGWQTYDRDMPPYTDPKGERWSEWGYYRLVQIQGKNVLLFKSNTHLSWPGQKYLEGMIVLLIEQVKPQFLLSIGTAGGARLQDHEGTVNVVRAGTIYMEGQPPGKWPTFVNAWQPNWNIIEQKGFAQLLFPIPVTESDLELLCQQFNDFYGTHHSLSKLNADGLDWGDPVPQINNLTQAKISLLSTDTFVVATTSGNYADFACVEMDDAYIGKVCLDRNISFGFVRNISDPAQNASLPMEDQGKWGSVIYEAYGFYTSYNGALAAWAIVSAQLDGDKTPR